MNKQEMKGMSKEELKSSIEDLRAQYYKLLNQKQTEKKVDKPHMFRKIRRNIARAKTFLNKESS
jgi:ribosomal protein L29